MTDAQFEALEPTKTQIKLLNHLDAMPRTDRERSDAPRVARLEQIARILSTLTYQQVEHLSEVGMLKDLMFDLIDHAEMAFEDESSMVKQFFVAKNWQG